ncbi:hypothetical protein KBX37_16300 [Micromonospora sp. U56]|uniref:hypothetical protein n=1 Tax=Micromonospora sp. U56 TaxID=2824900 RepID=UPI001B3651D2|nr:hypothetical protein [Micromonospora sp. U56]MBQ0894640.1 hypothetical protein [Micromonospora sp. U56]
MSLLQGPELLLLVVFGSAALTFVVPRPRLLWVSLLAAVCGLCEGRLLHIEESLFDTAVEAWLVLLLPAVVVGAGFARVAAPKKRS